MLCGGRRVFPANLYAGWQCGRAPGRRGPELWLLNSAGSWRGVAERVFYGLRSELAVDIMLLLEFERRWRESAPQVVVVDDGRQGFVVVAKGDGRGRRLLVDRIEGELEGVALKGPVGE